ncbi:MAG: pyridoxamine 5'-phosphate oxidase family protein [Ferruginibacter sp.]
MPAQDDNLLFLENKIQEIKMAIFRAETGVVLQLTNNIISTIKTDSDGNIWFFTTFNSEYLKNVDKHFFAYLEYCQQEQYCRLRLSGKASIVVGDGETGSFTIETNSPGKDNIVLIKFKILYAEYLENKQSEPISVKEKVKSFFTGIFIPHSHRKYDYS